MDDLGWYITLGVTQFSAQQCSSMHGQRADEVEACTVEDTKAASIATSWGTGC